MATPASRIPSMPLWSSEEEQTADRSIFFTGIGGPSPSVGMESPVPSIAEAPATGTLGPSGRLQNNGEGGERLFPWSG